MKIQTQTNKHKTNLTIEQQKQYNTPLVKLISDTKHNNNSKKKLNI